MRAAIRRRQGAENRATARANLRCSQKTHTQETPILPNLFALSNFLVLPSYSRLILMKIRALRRYEVGRTASDQHKLIVADQDAAVAIAQNMARSLLMNRKGFTDLVRED